MKKDDAYAGTLPNVSNEHLDRPDLSKLAVESPGAHKPRILLLYGSLRARSYSRFLAFEAARLLQEFGAETRIFDPHGLPLPDGAPDTHPKVKELRDLAAWSEGQVWCSPERHGAMSGVMKSMIDWIPLSVGAVQAYAREDACGDASQRWFPVVQCGEPNARPRALDANDHDSQSIISRQGVSGIRR